ncbi:MAG TPA: membrane dipeptidase [Candidatus Binataceae bacterium]|nr:membrane dipeptidase [Candidatus Binataceae bacterium]
MTESIRWDAHSCVPIKHSYSIRNIIRHKSSGFDFVSINVGMDMNPVSEIVQLLASLRSQVAASNDMILVSRIADVLRAKREGKLAVAFDLEGSVPLLDNLAMVQLYYDLGVRQMHLAYNRGNSAAGGCYDPDAPLTPLGKEVVGTCQQVGMMVDCSHMNERSALAIMEIANKPVIFSHSNPRALNPNLRNITDAMIDACARTRGAIGVNGMSNFQFDRKATIEGLLRSIDYIVQRTGPAHAGIGLDYVYDQEQDELPPDTDPAYWFPPEHGYDEDYYRASAFVPPEKIPELMAELAKRGYSDSDLGAIWGGNFFRIASECWKS